MREYDRAIADYNEAIRLGPRANFYTNRGDAYQFKKDYDHAIADYNEALKLDPKFTFAYNNSGAAYRAKGDLERAIYHYEQAVRLDPSDDTAVENLEAVRRERDRLAMVSPRLGPSFSCATTKRAVEKAICSDHDLIRLDRDMNAAYQSALSRLTAPRRRRCGRTSAHSWRRATGCSDVPTTSSKEMERRLEQLLAMGR